VSAFEELVRALSRNDVRFIVIGVWGANYYATSGGTLFTTEDRDLFLPSDATNLLAAWQACESVGLRLWSGNEPMDKPLDDFLAERIVARRALTKAMDDEGLEIDLTLEMAGFEFGDVWRERRVFRVEGVEIPVARLKHIVESKAKANRPKDRLFLETHAEALAKLIDD
jgi:hypothetical protein